MLGKRQNSRTHSRLTQLMFVAFVFFLSARQATAEQKKDAGSFWDWFTFCYDKSAKKRVKKETRECVSNWFNKSNKPDYGIFHSPIHHETRRMVLFVHGFNSRPEDLRSLAVQCEKQGFITGFFRFPNDQSLDDSSKLLKEELEELSRQQPFLEISFVTHSMGGLITRDVLESSPWRFPQVKHLVMLTPPNHGSHLAKYAYSLDLLEYARSPNRRAEAGLIVGSFEDGLCEASDDLLPDSAYLQKLNSRSRNKNVRYTIVLGTKAKVDDKKVGRVQSFLSNAGERCSWVRCASDRLDRKVKKYDELIDGMGDGAVSVKSGMLDGVDDVIYGEVSHGELLDAKPSTEAARIRKLIVNRLQS